MKLFNEYKGDVMDYDGMGNYGRFPCQTKVVIYVSLNCIISLLITICLIVAGVYYILYSI